MNCRKSLYCSGICFVLFLILILLVKTVGVDAIGPQGTEVGLAKINGFFSERIVYNDIFYKITELLGYLAILICAAFGAFGLYQIIKGKSLKAVDKDILILGAFYIAVIAVYVFFEKVVISYRPVILDEGLEASFPSSHTMLSVCVFISAIMQLETRLPFRFVKPVSAAGILLAAITVLFRFLSGVHWFTDILGGILISASLLFLFAYFFYNSISD